MSQANLPEIGKISNAVFTEFIFPHLGSKRDTILVGPQHGVDVGIVEIGSHAVALTTDPVFIVPEYGWQKAAWFALHILVSDVVTSGLPPTYLSIDLNLPMEIKNEELEIIWKTIHYECERLGMAVICGHTGRYENCHFPMVGGATVISVGSKEKYVTPGFAKPGDKIIITKGPAIEAAGIFAAMFPRIIEHEFGSDFAQKAQGIFYKMSVVEDALTAVTVGVREEGVSAMHDATEGGIYGGLHELLNAAGLGARIDKDKIVVEDGVREICQFFGIDPFASISEGTLIIFCREHKAQDVVRALSQKSIPASIVGELTNQEEGMILIEGGKSRNLEHPEVDPFWKAFYRSLKEYGSAGI
jgi:hydrogenase maturation factor